MYSYKMSEEAPVMLILKSAYQTSAEELKREDLAFAIAAVKEYFALSSYYQYKIKTEEPDVYNEIIAKQAKTEKVIRELIAEISLDDGNADERFILRSIYNEYIVGEYFAPLTNEEKAKAEVLIEQCKYLPFSVFNMSSEADRACFGIDDNAWKWSGTIAQYTDETEGEVLAVKAISFSDVNNKNVTISYELSGKSLLNYDYVHFKVYNPRSSAISLHLIKRGYGCRQARQLSPSWDPGDGRIYIFPFRFDFAGVSAVGGARRMRITLFLF